MSTEIRTDSKILGDRLSHLFGTGPFGKFRDYLNLMESYLQQELEKHNESLNEKELEEYSKTAGEHHREYMQFLVEEHFKEKTVLAFDFPHSFRSSLVIQIFSFLEFELKNICKYHSSFNNSDFSITDLKGNSDVEKAKIYLTKGAKIDFKQLNPEWPFIDCVRIIRNLLVHHQGIIVADNPDFLKIKEFAENNDLELRKNVSNDVKNNFDLIIPNKKMPEGLIKNGNSFIDKILEKLNI
ncbi:MAG: hypothetical protein RIB71_20270 [Imperialibacter sp.]|uniref:hypothetical protein n=1 Tax=Imperialibacter sp. TaxID=2038411 RepID=UPI0032ECF905